MQTRMIWAPEILVGWVWSEWGQAGLRCFGWENFNTVRSCRMSRLDHLPSELLSALRGRRLLKVISGLTNFDAAAVERISRAAAQGKADLLDIACQPELVHLAASASHLPICVSAVDPELFPDAVAAGASMVEIGNYDAFYPMGRVFDAAEVLAITRRSRELLPEVVLSATVPHVLPLDQQERLAVDLVAAGADLIQTEGGTSARPFSAGALGMIEKAAPTLAAAHAISRALAADGIDQPVLCASGLTAVTVPMAIAAGASGVGVGSAVNRLDDELAMVAVVRGLREALGQTHGVPVWASQCHNGGRSPKPCLRCGGLPQTCHGFPCLVAAMADSGHRPVDRRLAATRR